MGDCEDKREQLGQLQREVITMNQALGELLTKCDDIQKRATQLWHDIDFSLDKERGTDNETQKQNPGSGRSVSFSPGGV